MKETIYVETSVVSYYTSKPSRDLIIAARQEITREKWSGILGSFDSHISALVIQEAKLRRCRGSKKKVGRYFKYACSLHQ